LELVINFVVTRCKHQITGGAHYKNHNILDFLQPTVEMNVRIRSLLWEGLTVRVRQLNNADSKTMLVLPPVPHPEAREHPGFRYFPHVFYK